MPALLSCVTFLKTSLAAAAVGHIDSGISLAIERPEIKTRFAIATQRSLVQPRFAQSSYEIHLDLLLLLHAQLLHDSLHVLIGN